MKTLKPISALALIILLFNTLSFGQASETQTATASGQPEIYFVPDVVGQFSLLALRPDPLAFGLGNAPDPSLGKHYQGIVRRHGPGTPYVFVARSGMEVDECKLGFCEGDDGDDPGNLDIVKLETRDTNGERLRSNRLRRGWSMAGTVWPGLPNFWPTPPDARDKVVKTIFFNGHNGWPNYGHPGGMQIVGDILVVPLLKPYTAGDPAFNIIFIDISNPESPVLKSQFNPLSVSDPSDEFEAGQVAVTPVLNPQGAGVRYIMLIAGKNNKDVRLYRSLPTCTGPTDCTERSTNLKATNLKWEFLRSWTGEEMDDPGKDSWPCCGSQSYQMFNFVRQASLDGPLYLIGSFNTDSVYSPGGGTDYLDLHKVNVDPYGNPQEHLLLQIERKHVATGSIGGGGDTSHFTGSAGVYVSPTGELIVYASQHNNEGPFEELSNGFPGRRTVRFGEWRHREMVRSGSPTTRPGVEAIGTFEVDEGGSTLLTARAKAAITKAWIQFFEDDDAGITDNFDGNEWLAVDYQDSDKDNYDDFNALYFHFNDNAGSWRWFAPQGCSLQVNQHSFDDSDFPGARKTLAAFGGGVKQDLDLNVVMDDTGTVSMDDMISSLQFVCDDYYNAPLSLLWDLDLNGSFETPGILPTFSAAELDGPRLLGVPVRAQHPTDTSPIGRGAPSALRVNIRNVAPTISNLELVDSLGFKVGVDVPFAVANLEYVAQASFTDPGKPDHQSAQLDFGDGTIVQSSTFDSFSDAFGGATGKAQQRHRYRASGTYTIVIEVKDDDNGVTTATKSITVVTPAEVIGSVVSQIDQLLGTATNQRVIRALRDARDHLAGNNSGSANNGALDALASNDLLAALEKIKAAIESLQGAETAGAGDLRNLKYLLGLSGESIAQGVYQDAVDAVGSAPSAGQATQLERTRQSTTDGHALLVTNQFVPAIDLFKDAVGRALSLP